MLLRNDISQSFLSQNFLFFQSLVNRKMGHQSLFFKNCSDRPLFLANLDATGRKKDEFVGVGQIPRQTIKAGRELLIF